jgi:hypothetical protein
MLVAPRGPIMVRSSIKTYVNALPSFFAYLAGTGDRINGPADLRARHIDGFERWLAAQGKSRVHAPTYVAKIVSVLRRIAVDQPELFDPGLRDRLRYVSSHPHARSALAMLTVRSSPASSAKRHAPILSPSRRACGPAHGSTKCRDRGATQSPPTAIEARGTLKLSRCRVAGALRQIRWSRNMSARI